MNEYMYEEEMENKIKENPKEIYIEELDMKWDKYVFGRIYNNGNPISDKQMEDFINRIDLKKVYVLTNGLRWCDEEENDGSSDDCDYDNEYDVSMSDISDYFEDEIKEVMEV